MSKKFELRELDLLLEEKVGIELVHLNETIRRTLLRPMLPQAETAFALRRYRKRREIFALAIVSWYLPEFGCLLREDLIHSKHFSDFKDQKIFELLLQGNYSCLRYLGSFSKREIKGNWLPLLLKLAKELKFLTLYPNRAKRHVHRRGYRDKGSCRPDDRWLPNSDYSFTEKQNQLENQKDFQRLISSSIKKYGLEGAGYGLILC